jgi:hypothetical protein
MLPLSHGCCILMMKAAATPRHVRQHRERRFVLTRRIGVAAVATAQFGEHPPAIATTPPLAITQMGCLFANENTARNESQVYGSLRGVARSCCLRSVLERQSVRYEKAASEPEG